MSRGGGESPTVFFLWLLFCLVLSAAPIAGVVWLILELLPHITGALDRAGQ